MDIRDKNRQIENFYQDNHVNPESFEEEALLDSPHDILLESLPLGTHLHWEAPEFEKHEKGKRWYAIATLLLAAIIIYGLFTNSPIMAITFILIGIVGYIQLQREPQVLDFLVTESGIIAGNEIYAWETIQSFWIFYHPPYEKFLSLEIRGKFSLHVKIPLGDVNPAELRKILLEFIPEIEQESRFTDTISRIFHL
jgi:hypothetical protein